ncbi:MAG TPA: type I polyketide synthase [Candidatus Angelobacter sp.]|jgi:enediyne polyketide synthase|nr:type I polyketide synthase [Candidatus Angelobacter sp.]
MSDGIAIVGLACCYPGANTPQELWENVLAQRRAFRRMPAERLRIEDHFSDDRSTPDATYSSYAALIEGYVFDRIRFRVAGESFRATDMAHWLALDVASRALADAGWADADGLPKESTRVIVGNTLTGEFSRAATLRLRWPYVRRVLESTLSSNGWKPHDPQGLFDTLEARYKEPFAPVGEETLAGGLSNTIAGRICNFFDFGGGGFTLDGACASSLLAVAEGCSALAAGDVDLVLAGGVDLSMDPFELVGFAKVGALASGEMRVFDQHPTGFLPGEGCGFVVLMRHADAMKRQAKIQAVIRGWGISSDGKGGITRPDVEGQLLALKRAYQRAGFGAETVPMFEGHGTGTAVGDETELQALTDARSASGSEISPAAISSIKAVIGHTKAAAGVAGLIESVKALEARILPPATGCSNPHPLLKESGASLHTLSVAQPWPDGLPLRAGVSAMGFGGINCHLVLENPEQDQPRSFSAFESKLVRSNQGAEVFCFSAVSGLELTAKVRQVAAYAARLSLSELTDLAAELAASCSLGLWRAAVVAASPEELQRRLQKVDEALTAGTRIFDGNEGIFAALASNPPRITFLFPGQGSPVYLDGGILPRRFPTLAHLFTPAAPGNDSEPATTDVAQPAIVRTEIAGLKLLQQLGIEASAAVGHSLGELVALHWAQAFDEAALLRIAETRGKSMAGAGHVKGAMAMIAADVNDVRRLLQSEPVVIAGINSPLQTVLSGEAPAVARVVERARQMGLRTAILPVQHAFHSPLMEVAELPFREHLGREQINFPRKKLYSTVSGAEISNDNIEQLLVSQLTAPVLFLSAMQAAGQQTDLFIEVGPGSVLSEIARSFLKPPVASTDAGSSSLKGFLTAVAAAFVMGSPVELQKLFADRFTRRFSLDWVPSFFANPCESAPAPGQIISKEQKKPAASAPPVQQGATGDVLTELIQLVASRCELPLQAVSAASRLRDDLHLNSISVSQIIVEAARRLDIQTPPHPTDYSNVTLAEAAHALEAIRQSGGMRRESTGLPHGVAAWTRAFHFELFEEPLARRRQLKGDGEWRVLAPDQNPRAQRLQNELLEKAEGAGVVVWLPVRPDAASLPVLLQGAALAQSRRSPLVVIQHGWGASAFCRSLHTESPEVPVAVLNIPAHQEHVAGLVLSETAALSGFVEAHYDDTGRRHRATLCALPIAENNLPLALDSSDVLLVTGGGKGIGAECALQLARESGCKVILLGRSKPELDAALVENLKRFAGSRIPFRYLAVDVADARKVKEAVQTIEGEIGPITAVLHAAGVNQPCRFSDLDEQKINSTLAPKVVGAQNLIAAVNAEHLRFFIAFGSIIARTGLHGEAHYGLANEWLAALVEDFQTRRPRCRCMVLEWSVWSGTGMGESLGTIEALRAQGVAPIPVDAGANILKSLLSAPPKDTRIVVSSRFAQHAQLLNQPDLPLRRFLEITRVYYPRVELVVDSELSSASDPYLQDHVLKKEQLVPAVVSLEAMAQVASVLLGASEPLVFESVEFAQAISVPLQGKVKVRVAGLVTGMDAVDLVIRTEVTGFAVDHVRATCKIRSKVTIHEQKPEPKPTTETRGHGENQDQERNGRDRRVTQSIRETLVPLDCERDLYDQLLFHQGRFRCVTAYYKLAARECLAELKRASNGHWFARHLPAQWLLGRPDVRDAAIHAIQACIPHARVLPVEIQRLEISPSELPDHCYLHARELSQQGSSLIYDLEIMTATGEVLETWSGLKLQMVEPITPASWSPGTLSTYLERKMADFAPSSPVNVTFEQTPGTNGFHKDAVHRPYGRPEIQGSDCVSFAHSDELTMLATAEHPVACDLEPATGVPRAWQELLGTQHYTLARLVSARVEESFDIAATRIWSALECLKKAEAGDSAPLSLLPIEEKGWVLLRSGPNLIATFSAAMAGRTSPLIVAVLAAEQSKRLALADNSIRAEKSRQAYGD